LNSLSKGLYNIVIFCIRETVDPVHRRRALYARRSNRNLLPPLKHWPCAAHDEIAKKSSIPWAEDKFLIICTFWRRSNEVYQRQRTTRCTEKFYIFYQTKEYFQLKVTWQKLIFTHFWFCIWANDVFVLINISIGTKNGTCILKKEHIKKIYRKLSNLLAWEKSQTRTGNLIWITRYIHVVTSKERA
jgi:hypothetical protein